MQKKVAAITLVLAMSGCASVSGGWRESANDKLDMAFKAGQAVMAAAAPIIDMKCMDAAVNCVNLNITDPDQCQGWVKCNGVRRGVGMALLGLNQAIMDARLAIAAGAEKDALDAAERALDLVRKIKELMREVGV